VERKELNWIEFLTRIDEEGHGIYTRYCYWSKRFIENCLESDFPLLLHYSNCVWNFRLELFELDLNCLLKGRNHRGHHVGVNFFEVPSPGVFLTEIVFDFYSEFRLLYGPTCCGSYCSFLDIASGCLSHAVQYLGIGDLHHYYYGT